jgi:heptosyltransferase-2
MYKILIVAPSWVGDAMLMQPMLARLKQRHSGCRIDVFAPPWTAGLLHALPEVDSVISNPFAHGALQLKQRYQLGRKLRAAQYDQAIVLPNSLKSALVTFFAGIPLRTGFIGESRYGLLNDARKLDKAVLPLMVERFAYLAEAKNGEIPRPLHDPKLHISEAQRDATLQKLALNLTQPVVVFCPGAEYGPAKRWPENYYAELATRFQKLGYAVWLVGSNKDQPVAEKINELSGGVCLNLCGKTDLADALALLSCASVVVSNDSGLMHLAAAQDKPLLALFGSSSPQFTPPLSAKARVIKIEIACSPCFKRECPLGHFNCMMELTPELVWQQFEALEVSRNARPTTPAAE